MTESEQTSTWHWYELLHQEHLLDQLPGGVNSWLLIILMALLIGALVKGADTLVGGAVMLARRTGMPNMMIGARRSQSLGTTAPDVRLGHGCLAGQSWLGFGQWRRLDHLRYGDDFGLICMIQPMAADSYLLSR